MQKPIVTSIRSLRLILKKVYVLDMFENLQQLMQPTLNQKNIELEIIMKDPDLMVEADTNLVEQVLINLLVNAIEAVKDKTEPRIVLSAYHSAHRKTVIKIADNGAGMSEEVVDKIFIPFFSTKENRKRYRVEFMQTDYDVA